MSQGGHQGAIVIEGYVASNLPVRRYLAFCMFPVQRGKFVSFRLMKAPTAIRKQQLAFYST